MKTAFVLAVCMAAPSFAAEPQPATIKKLGAVTWNLETHKLSWTVQTGTKVNGEFVADSERKYEISPDEARMMVAEEQRNFSEDEAVTLHQLLDVLSVYCAESVVWWDHAESDPAARPTGHPGEKTDKNEAPKAAPKPAVKVKEPAPPAKKKPVWKVADTDLVALGGQR